MTDLYWLDGDADELAWQERGLCAQTDPEAFFPEKGGSTREAKRVCLTCDVRLECLEYATRTRYEPLRRTDGICYNYGIPLRLTNSF